MEVIYFTDCEHKRLSHRLSTSSPSTTSHLSSLVVDSSKDTHSLFIPSIRPPMQTSNSGGVTAIRPIPVLATPSLSPSLTTHPAPIGTLALASNPPPLRPLATSHLTTALQQQLLPHSYLHGVHPATTRAR